jgi:GNAT superfamily N-acetyltransferase
MPTAAVAPVPLHIRRCVAGDLRPLEWGELYRHDRAIIEAAYRRQRTGDSEMLVAELMVPTAGLPATFPVAQLWMDFACHGTPDIGLLWAFRVFPSLCGHGIGTRLLVEAEERLRKHGMRLAEVGVEQWNREALRLYQRQGYRLLGGEREIMAAITPEGAPVRRAVKDQWVLRKPL